MHPPPPQKKNHQILGNKFKIAAVAVYFDFACMQCIHMSVLCTYNLHVLHLPCHAML